MKLRILLMILLVGTGASSPPPQQQNALQALAASMQPGWSALATINANVMMNPGSAGAGIIIPYAMVIKHDTVRNRFYFIGGDHRGGTDPDAGWNIICYDATTNTWIKLPKPPYYSPGPPTYTDSHGYVMTAVNVAGRKLYRLPYQSNVVQVFNLDADDTANPANWSTLQVPDGNYTGNSIEFFPEINTLLVFVAGGGSTRSYSETTRLWTETPGGYHPPLISSWTWIIYNPVLHECLFGSSTRALRKMKADGTWEILPDIPPEYSTYDAQGSGFTGTIAVDPVSGEYLILTAARDLVRYNSITRTYAPAALQVPDKKLAGQYIATSVPQYGVTFWPWAVRNVGAGVYLYKHSVQAPPPVPTTFAEKCAQPGVMTCKDFDAQSQLRYTYSTNSAECIADPFIQPNRVFTNNRLAGEPNTVATSYNGACHYPRVDTAVKHSGAGSLKFTIPSNSPANTSGNFTEPFDGLGPTHKFIGPTTNPNSHANTVYMQFYQYVDSNFLTTAYAPGGGWKQLIWYGNTPNGSNSSGIEITHVNGYLRGVPALYGQAGADDYGTQDVRGCAYTGGPPSTYTEPPCIKYKANQWMETTVRVDMGTTSCYGGVGAPGNTRVRMWIEGSLAVDNPRACVRYNAGEGDGLGQFVITPFQTGKDASQVTPIAYTWYDDLIISTQPIAMKTGTTPPPPQDTIPPTVSMLVPAAGSTITGSAVAVAADAKDNVAVAWVQFTLDGVNLGALDNTSPYALTWDSTQVLNGAHVWRAIARDTAGLQTTSTAVSVTVNNPVTGVNTAPVLSGMVCTPTASLTSANCSVTITDDMKTNGNMVMSWTSIPPLTFSLANYQWSPSLPFVSPRTMPTTATGPAGTYSVTVRVNDSQFAVSSSVPLTLGSTPPPVNAAPVVQPLLPVTVEIAQGQNTASAVLTAVASDDGLPAGSTVSYQWSGTGVTFGNPTQQATNATAPAGNYTVTVTASDGALSASQPMAFTVTVAPPVGDTTAPVVTFKTLNNSEFSSNSKLIEFMASDNVGVVSCIPTVNGIAVQATPIFTPGAKLPTTTKFYLQQSSIPKATYVLGVSCKDAAGNTGTAAAISVIRK